MRFGWSREATSVVVACVFVLLLGCLDFGSVIHLIPNGYVGPVVVVYESPGGQAARYDERAEEIYDIPSDGLLRLSTPPPERRSRLTFYYVQPDGTHLKIPYDSDKRTLQVFAYVDGVTAAGEDGRNIRWAAYVVGVPEKRDDWVALRIKAEEEAIGRRSQ